VTPDVATIRSKLCDAFCRDVGVWLAGDRVAISLPMTARDGDHITAYAEPKDGGWRVSDMGVTLMRLSYEHDLSKLLSGPRQKLYAATLAEGGLAEDDGDIYVEVPGDALIRGLFALGQGVTKVEGLGLWTRARVESTFYDDLHAALAACVPAESLVENYIVPGVPSAADYPVDYRIMTPNRPLFVFGVSGRDKARLTTIVLQHLIRHAEPFDSMVVCQDVEDLPKADRNRLMNAANDVVAHIGDTDAIEQKIRHRVAA